jgi:eukaryotic-like serine/threonine-protein kinase
MATPAPDRVVADRYALKAPLGRGGMGVVWHAHDTLLDRAVAVKEVVLPPTMPDEERRAAHARVRREARAAARLNHPGAVVLYDVVQDQGHPFIVMELVPASTLADLVRTRGPLPPGRVAEIGAQLAATLEAAHRAGIVHRDVKPGNVMVAEDGGVKLADFGVASLQGDPQLTATGLVLGSPAYMAPEQAAGEPSGPPADFWALGATMFFAVEGVPPFDKGASIATLAAVVNEDPQPMRRAGPLAPLVRALLTKDPATRPPGPRVRAELERLAAAAATSVTKELPAHPKPPPSSTTARLPAIPFAAPLATPPAAPTATPPAGSPATPPSAAPAAQPTGPLAAEPVAEAAVEPASPEPAEGAAERTDRSPAEATTEPARLEPEPAAGAGPVAAGPGFGVRPPAAGEGLGPVAAGGGRPVPPVAAPGRPGGGRLLGYLALVALVVLAGMLIAWAASTLGSDGGGGAAPNTSGGATATSGAQGTPGAAGQLPAGWTSFTNRRGNDVVGVPPGWQARARESFNAAVVEEPDGARRVFTVRSANPANPLPKASRDYRAHARQNFQGFREIRFDEDATYAGRSGAVVFEYEALRDGRRVHVSHINFKGRTWGYNVEFVTPAGQWDSSQQLARQFEQAFRALG